jgi:hypothetical protein
MISFKVGQKNRILSQYDPFFSGFCASTTKALLARIASFGLEWQASQVPAPESGPF